MIINLIVDYSLKELINVPFLYVKYINYLYLFWNPGTIPTGGCHAQTLPVPVGPVHLNSGASVDLRGNSFCIYLWVSYKLACFHAVYSSLR